MKRILVISLFVMACMQAKGQSVTFIDPDDKAAIFFDSVKFVNPNYEHGIIVFKDNKQSNGTMNICTIDQKIHFVTPQKDTLVLTENDNVNRVFIKGKTYINSSNGYIEIRDILGEVCLGVLSDIELLYNVQTGAYGQKRQNATVQTVKFIDTDGYRVDLDSRNIRPFRYSKTPLLYRGNGAVLTVNKKNLMKCFPKQKAFIEEYISEHKPNLGAIEPVEELFKALAQSM